MADRKFGFETLCLHAGQIPDPATGARAAPIYQTTSFVFDSAEHAASLFNLQTFGNVYSRISNPTVAVFEERMAAIENGRAALACATGQAAEATAILTLCKGGDHIVSASTLYGGTHTLLGVNLKKLGIETTFVDPDDLNAFEKSIRPNTRLLYAETLGNPLINIVDIEALARIARGHDIPLVVDNTVPSPYLCRPFDWGADIVVHSATKYIGGHGTTMGGVIVESGKFDWGNGKFPEFTTPSPGYHGVVFHETFGDFGYTMKARMEIMRTFGPALSPMNAWLLLQGLESLPVRMDRHCDNALAVAKYLKDHPRVAWVNYPGLADDKYFALAKKYLPKGASGLLNFGVKGGARAGERFIDAAQFMSHLANIGDAKTLVIHPASTTHRQMNEEDQLKAGVTPDMVRMSVGIESLDDILWDIDQALIESGKA
ncbi:MAG TPA: O-acetylhomoserine aminocarboxypropyltransferase/cysteine synthase family protein [Burkholderiales bacterium]|nr:O-acetylhomoserine aminocarboxypropyltransferase/cysteine synthase family protein [Burkholderiales bacterium]